MELCHYRASIAGGIFVLEYILAYPLRILADFFTSIVEYLGGKSLTELLANGSFPFTKEEWAHLLEWYSALGLVGQGLLFAAVIATAFKFTAASMNPRLRAEASESFTRLFGAVFIILLAPFFVQTLFNFNAAISEGLMNLSFAALGGNKMPDVSFFRQIQTTSNLVDGLVVLVFSGLMLYLNIIFLIRKFVLAALLLFTPFVAFMWVLNKNVNAAGIYVGEIISNAFMPTAYAFTILVFSIFAPSQHWVHTLVWLVCLVTVAEMIRNSVQGLWTRLSGIDEVGTASRVMGALGFGGLASISRVASASIAPAPYSYKSKVEVGDVGISGVKAADERIKEPDDVVPKPTPPAGTNTSPALFQASGQRALAKALSASQNWGAIVATTVGRGASIAFGAMPGGGEAAIGMARIAGGLGRAAAFGVSAVNYYLKEYKSGERLRNYTMEMGINISDSRPTQAKQTGGEAGHQEGENAAAMKGVQEGESVQGAGYSKAWGTIKSAWRTAQIGYVNMGAPQSAVRMARTYIADIDGFRWR